MSNRPIYRRIMQRVTALGLTPRAASLRAGLGADVIRDLDRNPETMPRIDTIEALAPVLGVSPEWLAFGAGEADAGAQQMRRVTVTGQLQAGVLVPEFNWPEERLYDVFVPALDALRGETLYAAEVRGRSMNRVYPEGAIVVLHRAVITPEDLVEGKRYHVDVEKGPAFESTLKTVRVQKDRSIWLFPESDDPEFQTPIKLQPGAGVHFVGRVVFAIIPE